MSAESLLEENEKDIEDIIYVEAKAYVENALYERPVLETLEHRLYLHKWYYGSRWRALVFLCLFCLCGMVVFEHPYTMSLENDPTFSAYQVLGNRVSAGLELFFLLFISADIVIEAKLLGKTYAKRSKWWKFKFILCVLILINALICLVWPLFPKISRLARPFLFLSRSRGVRKVFSSMIRTIPSILTVSLLLLFHVLFFSFTGYALFRGVSYGVCNPTPEVIQNSTFVYCSTFSNGCTNYFSSLGHSVLQLFILLTTANYPEIMMPVYKCSRWSSLFFVAFLFIGLYFLLSIVLAVTCSNFLQKSKKKILKMNHRRLAALEAAFNILTVFRDSRRSSMGLVNLPSAGSGDSGEFRGITLSPWRKLMALLKPEYDENQVKILFEMLDWDGDGELSLHEFNRLPDFLELKIRRASSARAHPSQKHRLLETLERVVTNKTMTILFDILVVVNTIFYCS